MSHQYTVIGNPIKHSMSPQIHALFAEQTQRPLIYTRTLATQDNFATTVSQFFTDGGNGCNITLPFKTNACQLCDQLSESAELAESVNTISLDPQGRLTGHNTDGSGLVMDLTGNLSLSLSDMNILVLGAGGAARGIIGALAQQQPARIVIANRTVSRAIELARKFAEHGTISGCAYASIPEPAYDLVINATSTGLQGEKPAVPDHCINQHSLTYELMYSRETPFMTWAREAGAGVHDGLGMLLEQAADAFELWEGVRPKSRLIRARL